MELDNHITQLGLKLQKLLERTEEGEGKRKRGERKGRKGERERKREGEREREKENLSLVQVFVCAMSICTNKLQSVHGSQDSGYITLIMRA